MTAFLAATAAKLTVWEKILAVPRDTWMSLLLGIAVIVLVKRVWRDLKEINDIVPWIALLTVGGAVLLYWTYERTEPRLFTPLIDKMAEIFPTKFEFKGNKEYQGPGVLLPIDRPFDFTPTRSGVRPVLPPRP
jgi:hypothetical protein